MDQEQLKKKIELILTDLHKSANNFKNADEMNLGLFSANARYLFEHVDALRKIVAKEAVATPAVQVAPLINEILVSVPEVKKEEVIVPKPITFKEAVEVAEMLPESELSIHTIEQASPNAEPGTHNPQPATIPNGLNDRFKKEGGTLNERIAKPLEKNVGQMNHKPVLDLKTAIGINDKFLFINELFKGDKDQYNTVIEQLGGFSTLSEANDYLKTTCTEQYKWDKKQDLVDRFYTILSRKFSV